MDQTSLILTINSGESSIKYALFENSEALTVVFHDEKRKDIYTDFDTLTARYPIKAVGYRVVHGGGKYLRPTVITDEVLTDLRGFISLAPDHMPGAIQLIEKTMQLLPTIKHIACFDTTFYEYLPEVARTVPISRKLASELGIRKFGFHGISCASVVRQLADMHPNVLSEKVVIAHIGGGVSLTAVENGKVIDTTMGMTPASGVPMSTRSGDLDPGLVRYLSEKKQMTATKFDQMVNKESGLLGMSGISADMGELLKSAPSDPIVALAIDVFCYRIRLAIGALTAAMGGISALVFAGGIGENAPTVREKICEKLSFLGIPDTVPIYIIHTDEQREIALDVQALL